MTNSEKVKKQKQRKSIHYLVSEQHKLDKVVDTGLCFEVFSFRSSLNGLQLWPCRATREDFIRVQKAMKRPLKTMA